MRNLMMITQTNLHFTCSIDTSWTYSGIIDRRPHHTVQDLLLLCPAINKAQVNGGWKRYDISWRGSCCQYWGYPSSDLSNLNLLTITFGGKIQVPRIPTKCDFLLWPGQKYSNCQAKLKTKSKVKSKLQNSKTPLDFCLHYGQISTPPHPTPPTHPTPP